MGNILDVVYAHNNGQAQCGQGCNQGKRPVNHGWLAERRIATTSAALAADLAAHLLVRAQAGAAAIITEKPSVFYPVIRKYWLRLWREVRRERARTFDAVKIRALTYQLRWMQDLTFTIKDMGQAGVIVISPEDCASLQPLTTLYICCNVTQAQLTTALAAVRPGGAVIDYAGALEP